MHTLLAQRIHTGPVPVRKELFAALVERLEVHAVDVRRRRGTPRSVVCLPSSWVELRGLEPLTPSMPWRCATSCATAPPPRQTVYGAGATSGNPSQCPWPMRNRPPRSPRRPAAVVRPGRRARSPSGSCPGQERPDHRLVPAEQPADASLMAAPWETTTPVSPGARAATSSLEGRDDPRGDVGVRLRARDAASRSPSPTPCAIHGNRLHRLLPGQPLRAPPRRTPAAGGRARPRARTRRRRGPPSAQRGQVRGPELPAAGRRPAGRPPRLGVPDLVEGRRRPGPGRAAVVPGGAPVPRTQDQPVAGQPPSRAAHRRDRGRW